MSNSWQKDENLAISMLLAHSQIGLTAIYQRLKFVLTTVWNLKGLCSINFSNINLMILRIVEAESHISLHEDC